MIFNNNSSRARWWVEWWWCSRVMNSKLLWSKSGSHPATAALTSIVSLSLTRSAVGCWSNIIYYSVGLWAAARMCVLIMSARVSVLSWLTKYKLEINCGRAAICVYAVLTPAVSWNQLMLSGIKWHTGFSLIVPIVWMLESLIRLWWSPTQSGEVVECSTYTFTPSIHLLRLLCKFCNMLIILILGLPFLLQIKVAGFWKLQLWTL